MSGETWRIAAPLNAFYRRLAEHNGGGRSAAFAQFGLGFGLIDLVPSPPVALIPPAGLTALPAQVMSGAQPWRGATQSSWDGPNAIHLCRVDRGTFPAPLQVSCLGLYTADGALCAVASFLPKWIGPDDEIEEVVTMLFPEDAA